MLKHILLAILLIGFGFITVKIFTQPKIAVIQKPKPNSIPLPEKIYGVNISGAEFGPENLPGKINQDYLYPRKTSEYQYFADKGIRVVRLPIRWERAQRQPFAPLHSPDIVEIKKVFEIANLNNMKIILDIHNFGRYFGKALNASDSDQLADVWTKLALEFKDDPALYSYELMNEPHDLQGGSQTWAMIAQTAVNQIRKVDEKTLIIVPGYNWQNSQNWTKNNAFFPIQDPGKNIIYSAHIYFDSTYRGRYTKSFEEENHSTDIGIEYSVDFISWLKTNNAKGMFTEFGVPADPAWLTSMDTFLNSIHADSNITGAIYWGAGPWWKNYILSIEPKDGVDKPQIGILQKYINQ